MNIERSKNDNLNEFKMITSKSGDALTYVPKSVLQEEQIFLSQKHLDNMLSLKKFYQNTKGNYDDIDMINLAKFDNLKILQRQVKSAFREVIT